LLSLAPPCSRSLDSLCFPMRQNIGTEHVPITRITTEFSCKPQKNGIQNQQIKFRLISILTDDGQMTWEVMCVLYVCMCVQVHVCMQVYTHLRMHAMCCMCVCRLYVSYVRASAWVLASIYHRRITLYTPGERGHRESCASSVSNKMGSDPGPASENAASENAGTRSHGGPALAGQRPQACIKT